MNLKLNEVYISGTSDYNGIFVRKDAAESWMYICAILGLCLGFLIGLLFYA